MGMGSANADAASASSASLSALPLSKMKAGVVGELGGQTKGGEDSSPAGRIDALLEYYRARVAQFEKEREELLLKLDACSVSFQEAHRTSWEMKKKEEEVKELQKALSDAHTYVFDERERFLKLQAENDELKLQEVEDRKRIQVRP